MQLNYETKTWSGRLERNRRDFNAIIFDLDGVLIASDRELARFFSRLSKDANARYSPSELIGRIKGKTFSTIMKSIFPEIAPGRYREIQEKLAVSQSQGIFKEVRGATRFLRSVADRGCRVGIVTSAYREKLDKALVDLRLDDVDLVSVSFEDVKRHKPHRDPYVLCAKRLQVEPDRCLVFEDSESGIVAALASGAGCIGVGVPTEMADRHGIVAIEDFSDVLLYRIGVDHYAISLESVQSSGEVPFPAAG